MVQMYLFSVPHSSNRDPEKTAAWHFAISRGGHGSLRRGARWRER